MIGIVERDDDNWYYEHPEGNEHQYPVWVCEVTTLELISIVGGKKINHWQGDKRADDEHIEHFPHVL